MGQGEYGLKSLADDQLLARLASIVSRRNQITAEFLAYLAELYERQLFLDLGFSSLFEYCTAKLGLCESTAGRHISAARACREHPQAFALVASGVLHASALSLMRKHLTPENAAELFELCSRQSTRRVEELLAARFPRPDVRDLVRRLPARADATLDVKRSAERTTLVKPSSPTSSIELQNTSVESPSPVPSPEPPVSSEASKPRRFEPLSAGRFGVHFTVNGELCALLERVRGLAGHRLPSGDLMTLLQRGLEAYERELEKERFAVGRKTRCIRQVAPASGTPDKSERSPKRLVNPKRKRHYSAEVMRAVFPRDGKQCSYVSPDGRRCSALPVSRTRPHRAFCRRWSEHNRELEVALPCPQSAVCTTVLFPPTTARAPVRSARSPQNPARSPAPRPTRATAGEARCAWPSRGRGPHAGGARFHDPRLALAARGGPR